MQLMFYLKPKKSFLYEVILVELEVFWPCTVAGFGSVGGGDGGGVLVGKY